ncbi:hypothetical protein [Vibrio marisflavi]|uniref:Organic solvent tolerance-like N-terminal domain-containing protein n=1 Tax=Vibrio marisflavi CECT 7928 TaxID=634439 RepID=A0ABM9AAE8_9VIBR|nr:hypothetical protein [Vibrio marisflavi]CAH0543263.1 hypothetical protein VMF7928_04497 [Vibrio marisflavi CECT 7928]
MKKLNVLLYPIVAVLSLIAHVAMAKPTMQINSDNISNDGAQAVYTGNVNIVVKEGPLHVTADSIETIGGQTFYKGNVVIDVGDQQYNMDEAFIVNDSKSDRTTVYANKVISTYKG